MKAPETQELSATSTLLCFQIYRFLQYCPLRFFEEPHVKLSKA